MYFTLFYTQYWAEHVLKEIYRFLDGLFRFFRSFYIQSNIFQLFTGSAGEEHEFHLFFFLNKFLAHFLS